MLWVVCECVLIFNLNYYLFVDVSRCRRCFVMRVEFDDDLSFLFCVLFMFMFDVWM